VSVDIWRALIRGGVFNGDLDAGRITVGMARQGYDLQTDPVRRARVAGHVLHDRDGALTHERDGHRMGAHAVARDAAGSVEGVDEGRRGWLDRATRGRSQAAGPKAISVQRARRAEGRQLMMPLRKASLIVTSQLLVLMLMFSFLVGAAPAWDEPAGFRDIPWGAPPSLVKEKLPTLRCGQADCSGRLMIGEVEVHATFEFLTGGGLDSVSLAFPSANFYQIKTAFLERYGEPTKRRSEALQNRMGEKFQNEILEWKGEKVLIDLHRYSSKVTASRATIGTVEGWQTRLDKSKEKAKEGKKDL
jgi:hypothetical protein